MKIKVEDDKFLTTIKVTKKKMLNLYTTILYIF
jgi:hypothetical protein